MPASPPLPPDGGPWREPEPGEVLGGRYEIQSELGRGGMATVYRGRDLRLQRRVAVKVFRGGLGDAADPRRTTQEMRLLARVDHPSVVSVLDASTGDGVFGAYLVMELVTGDDLGALLHRARGPLAADFARRIVADVASALQALHDQGVVHRDVKPANILVPSGAGSAHSTVSAKLTDFGIAQLIDGTRLTGPESILGTAAYLSPEQVRGGAPQPASDVYALGLVLLEALTGERAFPGGAAEAAMARLHRPPAMPPGASPVLADLLSRMTALDPAHRPAAGDVATVLRERLAGRVTAPESAQTAPTPIAGVAAPVVQQDADATAAHVSTWTASRGMPIVTGLQPVDVPEPDPRRRKRFPAVLAVAASVLAAGVAVAAISAASSIGASDPHRTDSAARATKPPTVSAPPTVALPAPVSRRTVRPAPTPTRTTPTPTPTRTTPKPVATPTATATPTVPATVDPPSTPPVEPTAPPVPTETAPPAPPTDTDPPLPPTVGPDAVLADGTGG